ncbi:hypothetical protein F5887DRAFT_1084591 [Amanita rubescens]|nr:hypothetical protein F5887DRAFT_1084591 [Amanita rubescens]
MSYYSIFLDQQCLLMLCLVLCLHGSNYPQYILAEAGDPELNAEHQGIEAKFYGLSAMILDHWFPSANGHHSHVLLLVEIKPPWHYHQDAQHQAAIGQVIHHLDEVGLTNNYVPHMYAISAIGKGGGHVMPSAVGMVSL